MGSAQEMLSASIGINTVIVIILIIFLLSSNYRRNYLAFLYYTVSWLRWHTACLSVLTTGLWKDEHSLSWPRMGTGVRFLGFSYRYKSPQVFRLIFTFLFAAVAAKHWLIRFSLPTTDFLLTRFTHTQTHTRTHAPFRVAGWLTSTNTQSSRKHSAPSKAFPDLHGLLSLPRRDAGDG